MSCMLKLTKEEIAFLRWLRTNGGTASLSNIPTGFTERVIGTRYVLAEPDAYRPGTARYVLTEHGREALGLYEK
jgi:hypothetical protein